MVELKQVYRCPVCGNVVEVVRVGGGELVCCGQAMELQRPGMVDASLEKHVPVIYRTADGFKVVVGSEKHPMTVEHHIEWIELIVDGKVYREHLKIESEPEAEFCVQGKEIEARAYCNLHGLWSAKL